MYNLYHADIIFWTQTKFPKHNFFEIDISKMSNSLLSINLVSEYIKIA